MSEEPKKEGEEGAEAKPKSKKKLFIIIGAVVLLAVIGGVAAVMLGGKKEDATVEEKPVEEEQRLEITELAPVIVNLSDSSSFLKVTMLLEYDAAVIARIEAEHSHGAPAEGGGGGGGHSGGEAAGDKAGLPPLLAKREAVIRDSIIRVLSSKRASEILTSEGKERLKEELVEAINEASGLEEPAIVAVYFTEFLIQ
jgi:flagellar FliL protein